MKKYLLIAFLAFLSLVFISWKDADEISESLTLSELVNIALENHPSTKQAWWKAHRASSEVGDAKSAYYPKIDLQYNMNQGVDFKFINGPNTHYTIVGADFTLSMLLYDFGERSSNVNAAKMALIAANWHVDFNVQKVMIRVLEHAYNTLHSQQIVLAAESSLEDAEKVFYSAKELNRAGLSPISDVYIAQANLSQMRMELTQQKALLTIQRGKLASSLGLPVTTCLELAPLTDMEPPQSQDIDALIALALERRADLAAKQAHLLESLANQKKTYAANQPKLFLSGRGGANHALHDKTHGLQYKVSLDLEVPIFSGFGPMYRNRIANANTRLSSEELVELQLEISLEVLTHTASLQAAQQMLVDAEENLDNSTKAYNSVLDKYKAGKDGINDISTALQQLAAARVRYSDIRTRWFLSLANLAYATGTLAPYQAPSPPKETK